jgi:hypothetical protein
MYSSITDLTVRLRHVDSNVLLRAAIVCGVLALSVFLGPRASASLLLIVPGIAGILILMRRPELGLLALIPALVLLPISIGTGTQTAIPAALGLIPVLVLIWLLPMVTRRNIHLIPSPINKPAIVFGICATISLLAGGLPWNAFAPRADLQVQVGAWAIFIMAIVAMLLVPNLVTEIRWLQAMVAVFVAVGFVYIIARWLPLEAVGRAAVVITEAGGTGSLFWVWLVALAGGQGLFNRGLSGWLRLLLLAGMTATLATGWIQGRGWVSGWLPPALALLVLIWLWNWRLGLLATLAGAAYVLRGNDVLVGELTGLKQYSIDTRGAALQILINDMFPLSPILGLGPANYYHYTPLYPILGYYIEFNSHNNYVDLLLQVGALGTAAFLWLVAALGRVGWSVRAAVAKDGFQLGYVNACLAGLVGTLVACWLGDWFLPFVYNIGYRGFRASLLGWLFLGGLLAIQNIARISKDSMAQ